MIKRLTCGCFVLMVMTLLASCSSNKKNLGTYLQTNELVFNGETEKMPQRITPYTSMARAAKYNTDVTVKNIAEKIYSDDNEVTTILKDMLATKGFDDKLYSALQALDFVDIYAMSVLTDNHRYIENNLYAKTAQNLSAAAIKMHRQEIFADKELKEIDRLASSQEKILK